MAIREVIREIVLEFKPVYAGTQSQHHLASARIVPHLGDDVVYETGGRFPRTQRQGVASDARRADDGRSVRQKREPLPPGICRASNPRSRSRDQGSKFGIGTLESGILRVLP